MELFISLSQPEQLIEFPPAGPYGIEGSNTTTFVASPDTAANFVRYLRSQKVKEIFTGKRGKEYLIGWNGKHIDVAAWKAAGRKSS